MYRLRFLAGVAGLFAACLVGAGCGSSEPATKEADTSYQHLLVIRAAYMRAVNDLGRGPENTKELLGYVKYTGDGGPQAALRSPNDGLDYKIVFGVSREDMQPDADNHYPILAYEQQGKDGQRYVLAVKDITTMTDEQLKKAVFPPGHTNPFQAQSN